MQTDEWRDVAALPRLLLDSARRAAQEAVGSFHDSSESVRKSALQGGLSLEYFAKHCLALASPVLIADRSCTFETLRYLSGTMPAADVDLQKVRTVSGPDACKRVRELHPTFSYVDNSDGIIFDVRNSVCHTGIVDESRTSAALRSFIRLTSELIEIAAEDWEAFWGPSSRVAERLLNEATSEMRIRLETKLEIAEDRLRRLKSRFGPNLNEYAGMVTANMSVRMASPFFDFEKCKVCKYAGLLYSDYDKSEPVEPPELEIGETREYFHTILPIGFECEVCGLKLDANEVKTLRIRKPRKATTTVTRHSANVYESHVDRN